MEELIRTLTKFGGTVNEDVLEWLKNIDEVFDRIQLQPSNKYIATQSYLTKTAAFWFRFHKSNILDWSTFQFEIIKAFRPSFEPTLLKVGQQQQQSSSFLSSHLHNQSQPTFDEKLQQTQKEQEVLPIPVSTSSENSPPSTVFNKELDHENHQINLVEDNPIKLFEVLEDKCPCEHDPGSFSYMSVKISAPDWRIQAQCEDVSNDDEKLERQAEFVINSGSVQSTVKDVFKNIGGSIGHLTAAYTNGITAISTNTQVYGHNLTDTSSSSLNEFRLDDESDNNSTTMFSCDIDDCLQTFTSERAYRAHRNDHRRIKNNRTPPTNTKRNRNLDLNK